MQIICVMCLNLLIGAALLGCDRTDTVGPAELPSKQHSGDVEAEFLLIVQANRLETDRDL